MEGVVSYPPYIIASAPMRPPVHELDTVIAQLRFFENLEPEALERLREQARQISVSAGDIILAQGEAADAVWVILEGDVQIFKRRADGSHLILNKLRAGTLFGEQGLLNSLPRSASARAHTDVVALRISGPHFLTAIAPETRQQLARVGEQQRNADLAQESALLQTLSVDGGRERIIRQRTLADGEVLFREGDEAHHVFVVVSGRAAVYQHSDKGPVLLRRLAEGQTLGELALMKRAPRSATVIAEGTLRLYQIDAEYFFELQRSSPQLRDHLQTLERAYLLPRRGFVTQYAGRFLDREALNTIFDLNDGGRLIASNVVGESLCNLERIRTDEHAKIELETVRFSDPARGLERELRLTAQGALFGLTAQGEWSDLPELFTHALEGRTLDRARVASFRQTGSFGARAPAPSADVDNRIICGCVNVRRRDLHEAIGRGATTLPLLQQETRCGTVCGGCLPNVRELLGGPGWTPVRVHEELPVCEDIRTFRLTPINGTVEPSLPGQHIVIQAEIEASWVQRPYTLSARTNEDWYEVTIKREPQGVFSRWMFDQRHPDSPLRVSQPQGDFYWTPAESDVVCLVAGIGVTPALAICRTVVDQALDSQVYIDYSARRAWDFAYAAELTAAAETRPNIEVKLRETSREGRLDADDVAALAERFPAAVYILCGPLAYLDSVRELLAQAGVPADRVRVEVFTHVGDAPAAPAPQQAPRPSRSRRVDLEEMFPEPETPPHEEPPGKALSWIVGLGDRYGLELRVAGRRLRPMGAVMSALQARLAGIDPNVPSDHLALARVSVLGSLKHQLGTFAHLTRTEGPNRDRARKARQRGAPLRANTPDGYTFAYSFPSQKLPQFQDRDPKYRVNTGWLRTADTPFSAVYVTRSAIALRTLLCDAENVDRGPVPYHYWQQFVGYPGRSPESHCKAGGIFAGRYRNNQTWQKDRETATKQAGQSALDDRGEHMAQVLARICDDELDLFLDEYPDRVIDAHRMMMKLALRVILYTSFPGVDESELDRLGGKFVSTVHQTIDVINEFMEFNMEIMDTFEKTVLQLRTATTELIAAVRAAGEQQDALSPDSRSSAMTRHIIQGRDGTPPSEIELTSLIASFLVAGHETTAKSMSWALYELGRNPDLYRMIQAEYDTFHAAHGGRPITAHDYEERPYMLALLFELGRRHPPFPQITRVSTAAGSVPPDPETGIGGFEYPTDSVFVFSIIGIHMDPHVYPNPQEFRIERFLTGVTPEMTLRERGQRVRDNAQRLESQFRLLTFGAGDGMCIGRGFNMLEFFHVFDALLQRYDFELQDPEQEVEDTQVAPISGPTLGGIKIRLRRRAAGG